MNKEPLLLLSHAEQERRLKALRSLMERAGVSALLLTDYANLFWLTGRVFAGYLYVGPGEGDVIYFLRRPSLLEGDGVVTVRKPEQIAQSIGLNVPPSLGLELDLISANMAARLSAIFPQSTVTDATPLLRAARALKTPAEQQAMRRSGTLQSEVYRHIPRMFSEGMTDVDLQIAVEHALRLQGCLGLFRISGSSMETYMGSLIAGPNADEPSPYDFTMGGRGTSPSLPVGADGTILRPGMAVMVDLCGNFTGYMTDMTRTFAVGSLESFSPLALRAHELSITLCRLLEKAALPGAKAADLYALALEKVRAEGMEEYFMGHRAQAGFIGHGVGIEINELPVLAPRSRDVIAEGNTIALEPKFVIPEVGAVGIENTYVATSAGLERITDAPEELIPLL